MDSRVLPTGKPNAGLLTELLQIIAREDGAVIEGPSVGRDVALLDIGAPFFLAAKSDPITFATDEIGFYAVVVNANDLATRGATPCWMLATVLLPENRTTPDLARDIFRQLRAACDDFNITLVGGHTEITYGLDRPIVVGAMLGQVPRGLRLTPDNVRPGDVVLMTKAVAIEGTAIIARELSDELRRRGFEQEFTERCARMLHEPGISVLAEARAAARVEGLRTMHDPTEGGIATGLWELAAASGRRVVVSVDAIPVLPECRRLCEVFGIDPLGLIASGTMLMVASPHAADAVKRAVEDAGVRCTVIGHVEEGPPEAVQRTDHGLQPLPRYDQDELTKIL
ncbi:MAG: hydrogenase expression protein [Armatimonadetes bacterium]|nr:hydrogenase expression protein [Armatimonadota bacterium]